MSKRKKKSEKGGRIIAIIIGIFILLWTASGICIYELGDVTEARDVTVSRRKSSWQDESSDGKNWRFDVSYTYTVDDVDYNGLNTDVRGEWLSANPDNTVHYLPFAPRISSMYAEDYNSAGILIPIGIGFALILFAAIPRKKISKKHKRTACDSVGAAFDSGQRVTMAWLMENVEGYDDRFEEYYQNGWDEGV